MPSARLQRLQRLSIRVLTAMNPTSPGQPVSLRTEGPSDSQGVGPGSPRSAWPKLLRRAASEVAEDGRSLAFSLVKSGSLTPYQMEAVCSGTQTDLRLGNYEVLDRLGAGGMGAVFKARHRRMKRIVGAEGPVAQPLPQDPTKLLVQPLPAP